MFTFHIIYKSCCGWCCGIVPLFALSSSIAPSCRRRATKGCTKRSRRNKSHIGHSHESWIVPCMTQHHHIVANTSWRCCAECRTTINNNFPLESKANSQIARLQQISPENTSLIQRCDIFHQFGSHYYQSHWLPRLSAALVEAAHQIIIVYLVVFVAFIFPLDYLHLPLQQHHHQLRVRIRIRRVQPVLLLLPSRHSKQSTPTTWQQRGKTSKRKLLQMTNPAPHQRHYWHFIETQMVGVPFARGCGSAWERRIFPTKNDWSASRTNRIGTKKWCQRPKSQPYSSTIQIRMMNPTRGNWSGNHWISWRRSIICFQIRHN